MSTEAQAFTDWMAARLARAQAALEAVLPAATTEPRRLHDAMRYAVLGPGKRVRPLLVYAAGELGGAKADDVASLDSAACAVELIHAYSLVHDDLPCMDDDDLRRGRPTVHRQYDEATALLVGDALQCQAFLALTGLPTAVVGAALTELGRAAGSTGMAGGQAIDLSVVGQSMDRPALEDMHSRKTGAMLVASVRLGWYAARGSADVPAALDAYAHAVGLAFQVVDDILDVEADTATLGKTAGKDAAQNKPTFVSLLGLAGARDMAGSLHRQAREALTELGPHTAGLAGLADLITLRRH